jgi:L-lysine exporter family protein LysE/ArgO
MLSYLNGLGLGFGLIAVIGAQNALVLRQGLRGEHVLAVCLVCILSDVTLIGVGVLGFGALSSALPALEPGLRLGGAVFLFLYAARSLRAARTGGGALEPGQGGLTRGAAIGAALALTWLNPHVYLDTVALLGSVAARHPQPLVFGLGAMTASTVFFLALGYGARILRPVFARPSAWRWLDGGVAALMATLGWSLLVG